MTAIAKFQAVSELANTYGLEAEHFLTTMREIAMPKPHKDPELVSCLLVAREHGMNPLTREIYFMREKNGTIQAIIGVDGWIRKINEHPQFDGMTWDKPIMDKNGVALEMTCHIHRKDRSHPISVTEYMSECRQKRNKPGPWDTHPNRMLRNRTICQAARLAFGFAGVMDRDEFDQWQEHEDHGS
jgi:phage recombination protein Bet